MDYNFKKIEKKWQDIWYSQNTFAAKDDYSLPKFYCLVEFPYPSGQGLHVGHPRSYTALDIVARKKRLQGYNVLYPMGWDAFGLPTENYAIKNHVHPAEVTKQNIAHFKQQLQSLGFSFDWTRELVHILQMCACKRRSCKRCLRALRFRGNQKKAKPMDA